MSENHVVTYNRNNFVKAFKEYAESRIIELEPSESKYSDPGTSNTRLVIYRYPAVSHLYFKVCWLPLTHCLTIASKGFFQISMEPVEF